MKPNPESIPHLRKQGRATQLIVNGQPHLISGGELHNSSASSLAFMEPVWARMTALHLNTVLSDNARGYANRLGMRI